MSDWNYCDDCRRSTSGRCAVHSNIIIRQTVTGPGPCKRCGGTGTVYPQGRVETCGRCQGLGREDD